MENALATNVSAGYIYIYLIFDVRLYVMYAIFVSKVFFLKSNGN